MGKHSASPHRRNGEILLPTPEEREHKLRKLPTFEPHDLLELMGPTKKNSPELILKIRERNNEELRTLVARPA